MAIGIMTIILLLAAIIGGLANHLLPANTGTDGKSKLRTPWQCILLGLAATIMVPLFLELAQSKLLDKVRFSFDWEPPVATATNQVDTLMISTVTMVDSAKAKKTKSDSSLRKAGSAQRATGNAATEQSDLGKNYWLWAAYCIIAAAAGFRFIDMLINNVVKQDEIKNLKIENKELVAKEEKAAVESQNLTYAAEENAKEKIRKSREASGRPALLNTGDEKGLPVIGPIIHTDDPQKGRFGGKSVNNFRKLSAKVSASIVPKYYDVVIWVESTDPENHPLTADVAFYIHDSFRPNVYTITPINGKAEDKDILSYGAFTVGAVTDYGETLLELDLADDNSFPRKFREL